MAKKNETSGAHQPAGKHSECDTAITDAKVLGAAPEKVVDAKPVEHLVRRAIDAQVFTKGDEGGAPISAKKPAV